MGRERSDSYDRGITTNIKSNNQLERNINMKNPKLFQYQSSRSRVINLTITITKLFRLVDASQYLNMSENDIRNLVLADKIRYVEKDGKYFFHKRDLVEWMFNQNPRLSEPLKISYNFSRN